MANATKGSTKNAALPSAQSLTSMLTGFIEELKGRAEQISEKLKAAGGGAAAKERERERDTEIKAAQANRDSQLKIVDDQIANLQQVRKEIGHKYDQDVASIDERFENLAPSGESTLDPKEASALRAEFADVLRRLSTFEASMVAANPDYQPVAPTFDVSLANEPAPAATVGHRRKAHAEEESVEHKRVGRGRRTNTRGVQLNIPEAIEKAFHESGKKELKVAEIARIVRNDFGIRCVPKDISQALAKKFKEGKVKHNKEAKTWYLSTRGASRQKTAV